MIRALIAAGVFVLLLSPFAAMVWGRDDARAARNANAMRAEVALVMLQR